MGNPLGTASIEILKQRGTALEGVNLLTAIHRVLTEQGIETHCTITNVGIAAVRITVSAEAASILEKELPNKGFPLALEN